MVAPIAFIIDDDLASAGFYSQMLQRSGYQVSVAMTGLEAMNWMDTHTPAIIILNRDRVLTDVSGLEILHYIRQRFPLNSVPVMLLTAQDLDERDVSLELADVILNKPVPVTDFMYHAWQMLNHA